MADNSRLPIAYPSPHYAAQSSTGSWESVPKGWAPYPQPPTGSEAQFWQGQPNQTGGSEYPPGAPAYYGDQGYGRPPSESSERETVSDSTLLEQREYGHSLKSPAQSQRSEFYSDSNRTNSTLVHEDLYSTDGAHIIPIDANPERASDYRAQALPSPSPSDTYIDRFKKFANKIKSLPWMPRERVTVDYYPGTSKHSQREYQHRPLILWRNPDAFSPEYQSDDSKSSSENLSAMPRPLSNGGDLDLVDEFTNRGHSPPQAPQRLSVVQPAFENPVPVGYPRQRPQSTTWYPGMQQVALLPQVNPSSGVTYYQPIPQGFQPIAPIQSSPPMVPVFPGGYVPADQHQFGHMYGPPVHQ
jgi:hypothetical protein